MKFVEESIPEISNKIIIDCDGYFGDMNEYWRHEETIDLCKDYTDCGFSNATECALMLASFFTVLKNKGFETRDELIKYMTENHEYNEEVHGEIYIRGASWDSDILPTIESIKITYYSSDGKTRNLKVEL
jgi:hypothetical protein